jgi:hypothetical protein
VGQTTEPSDPTLERASAVVLVLGGTVVNGEQRVPLEAEQAWRAAPDSLGMTGPAMHAGLELALRRARRTLAKNQDPNGWFGGADWALDAFLKVCVEDAERIRAFGDEAKRAVGWLPPTASDSERHEAYEAAHRVAWKVARHVCGYDNKDLAEEGLHRAILRAQSHFAMRTTVPDSTNAGAYGKKIIRNEIHRLLTSRRGAGGREIDDEPFDSANEDEALPDAVALSSVLVHHLRVGVTALLFSGAMKAITAALALGIVSAAGQATGLGRWEWPHPEMPSDGVNYLLLRKCDPDSFTPHGGRFDEAQRQKAGYWMAKARSLLGQLWAWMER